MNMNYKEFIIERISFIVKQINDIHIRYAYDNTTDYNIIEVDPESTRRGNESYVELEADFWSDFYKSFPNENILISEVDEFNDMSNILFEVQSFANISLTTKSLSGYNYQEDFSEFQAGNICDLTYIPLAA